jgi:hypothetical protein
MRSLGSIEQNVVLAILVAHMWLVTFVRNQPVYILQPAPQTLPALMSVTFNFRSRTVYLDIIGVFYLPTDAQEC